MQVPRRIGRQIQRIHQKLHRAGALNSEPIALRWTELAVPPGYLADVETSPRPVATPRVAIVTAFLHYVNIHTTGYTRYTQVRQGDVILDFPGDVDLENKPQLRFEIGGQIILGDALLAGDGDPLLAGDGGSILTDSGDTIPVASADMRGGKIYVQKDGGDEIAASWDVRCNGQPVTRTVLVTLLS